MVMPAKSYCITAIVIGSEVLSGKTEEKNFRELSLYLRSWGDAPRQVHIIPDDPEQMLEVLQHYWNKKSTSPQKHLIITSGGLGPTKDDLTKQVLGALLGTNFGPNRVALKLVEEHYERLGKPYLREESFYHHLFDGMKALPNPEGLAPGLKIERADGQVIICALPGVPREFKSMLGSILEPLLKHEEQPVELLWKTYGAPEETLFKKIAPNLWDELSNFGVVSSLPSLHGVDLVLKTSAQLRAAAEKCVADSPLNTYVWSREEETIEQWLIRYGKEQNLTFATCESCTGGFIAHHLTNVEGSSQVFKGAVLAYQTDLKKSLLKIDEAVLEKNGPVSKECSQHMARACSDLIGADITMAITGNLGKTAMDHIGQPGETWLTILDRRSGEHQSFVEYFKQNRERNKIRATQWALHQLRIFLCTID